MRIAVCDDNTREQGQMIRALSDYDPACQPDCFASGKDFLEAASKEPYYDISFLDIYMPGENGMEIAEGLRAISPYTGIVFVTSSLDHAVDAFSVNALHYLVKPVTKEGVCESFRRLNELRKKRRPVISLSSGGGSHTVFLDEISYIQSVGHAKEIHLADGRIIRVWMLMEELEPKLGECFLKLNRSFIVNMEQIEQMEQDSCILRDGSRLDFARRERTAIRAAYDKYLFARLSGGAI